MARSMASRQAELPRQQHRHDARHAALRAEFATPTSQLLPGQFVRIRLLTGERDGVFLVPQAAVLQSEQGRPGDAGRRRQQGGAAPGQDRRMAGKDWVVLGGLKAGDKVIVDNLMKLRPGAPVAPHPRAGRRPAPARPTPAASRVKERPCRNSSSTGRSSPRSSRSSSSSPGWSPRRCCRSRSTRRSPRRPC
jgi:hypothetical protein